MIRWLLRLFHRAEGPDSDFPDFDFSDPIPLDARCPDTQPNFGDAMNFDLAFEKLIGHEGGYVDDPEDPGGETKFGISKRSYPREDIPNMTLERAKEIYRKDFWWAAGCDAVPGAAKFDLFDMAVNSGVKPAICTLQNAVGAVPDGIIGGRTLQALNDANPVRLNAHFNAHRLLFMTNLKNWPVHGKGWARRVAKNILEA